MLVLLAVVALVLAISSAASDLRRRNLTSATLFVVISVVFVNIGMLIRWISAPHPSTSADQALLVSATGLLSFTVAKLVVERIGAFDRSGNDQRRTDRRPVSVRRQRVGLARSDSALYAMCTVIMVGAATYYVLLGSIPLLSGLRDLVSTGTVSDGLVSRYRNARDYYAYGARYIPAQGLLEALRYWGLPLVIVTTWLLLRKRSCSVLAVVMIIASVAMLVATGQRWPLMYLLVAIFALGYSTLGWTWHKIRLWLLGAIAAGVVMSALLGRGAQGVDSVVKGVTFGFGQLVDRLFISQTEVPFASFNYSRPMLLDGAWLTWWQNLVAYLPGPQASYTVTFFRVVTHGSAGFTAPPDFYTEAWINGGLILTIALSAAWGFVCVRVGLQTTVSDILSTARRTILVTVMGFTAFAGLSQLISVAIVFLLATAVWWGYRLVVAPRQRVHPAGHLVSVASE